MRLLTLVLVLSLSVPALAQPAAVPLEHEGREGVWFVLSEARRLNALDANAGNRSREIRLLEMHLELATDFEIPALHRAIEAAREVAATWHGVVESAAARATEAEGRLDSIWRQPILWLLLGLAAGGILSSFLITR